MTSQAGTLDGRVAVVTGAARGIGAAVVARLAADGARVASLDLDEPEQAPGAGCRHYRCDITRESDVRHTIDSVLGEFGTIDVLVNNAGVNAYFDAVQMSEQDWDGVFAVDLKGAWLCAKHALPPMIAKGRGAIVNVSSLHARMTLDGYFPYAAAKAGLEGLTRSLALDVGPSGVRVNAVAPGYVTTRLVDEWLSLQADPGLAERIVASIALRRMAAPDEVAAAVCFLASDNASAITGATLAVDCGLSARFAS